MFFCIHGGAELIKSLEFLNTAFDKVLFVIGICVILFFFIAAVLIFIANG